MLRTIATGFLLAALTGPAAASPCDTARTGTFLSNVCWLLWDFPPLKNPRVVSVDQGSCTVAMEKDYGKRVPVVSNPKQGDPRHWRYEKKTERFTLHLGRVNLTESEVRWSRVTRISCLRLIGKNVHDATQVPFGRNIYTVCGQKDRGRVVSAVKNLYSRYCRAKQSEF